MKITGKKKEGQVWQSSGARVGLIEQRCLLGLFVSGVLGAWLWYERVDCQLPICAGSSLKFQSWQGVAQEPPPPTPEVELRGRDLGNRTQQGRNEKPDHSLTLLCFL